MDPFLIKYSILSLLCLTPLIVGMYLLLTAPHKFVSGMLISFIISMIAFFGVRFNFEEADESRMLKEAIELNEKYKFYLNDLPDLDDFTELKPKIKDDIQYVEKKKNYQFHQL